MLKLMRKITGNKLDQKFYRHHSGWVGGLKEVNYRTFMKAHSDRAMTLAVKGMVPDTTIGRAAMTRLRVYKGDAHKHQSQKPEAYNG